MNDTLTISGLNGRFDGDELATHVELTILANGATYQVSVFKTGQGTWQAIICDITNGCFPPDECDEYSTQDAAIFAAQYVVLGHTMQRRVTA